MIESTDETSRWRVDIWFDPSCPLTWHTADWLLRLAEQQPIMITWRLMSLSVLNEGAVDDPEGDPEGYLWVPVRICVAIHRRHGPDALLRFYRALWERPSGSDPGNDWLNDLVASLRVANLPEGLVDAGQDDSLDSEIRASHAAGVALVGPGLGTPILRLRHGDEIDRAFFGPVISRAIDGADATRLWAGLTELARVPAFTELKTGHPF